MEKLSIAADTNVSLVLRELDELRRRERAQRDELARRERMYQRLRLYGMKLRGYLRSDGQKLHAERSLVELAQLSSEALEVGRASIWLFDAARERMNCRVIVEGGEGRPSEGMSFAASDFPVYFEALLEGECLVVDDARCDHRTRELGAYLARFDVHALLDVPIQTADGISGVLRYGHVGSTRTWDTAEVDFAASVGAGIAVELEGLRRSTAERDARETAAKYRYLVESLPVTVYSFDLRTSRFDYLSPSIYELGGWTAEKWLREGSFSQWLERIHPLDREAVRDSAKQAMAGEPNEIVYRVVLDDQSVRWVRDRHKIVRDHTGTALFVQGVLADITGWKESEIYGSELERSLRKLLANVDMLAVILDGEGHLMFANDRFLQMSGRAPRELLGSNFFEAMVAPGERVEMAAYYREGLLAGDASPHFESTMLSAAGERRVLWTNQVLRRPNGAIRGIACLGLDLTDRLRLRQELLEQGKLDSLGRLAAGVAHDFNNLLTVMMSEVEALADVSTGETVQAAREVLQPALRQAADLTRALLTYAQQQPASPVQVSPGALLDEELGLLRAMAGKHLRLEVQNGAGDAQVIIDPSLLRQVLFNLVTNARDATEGYGQYIAVRTSVDYVDDVTARQYGAAQGGEYVTLSVSDDGRGMDAGTASRIFDPFFSTKPQGRGTGLGLSICRSVVRRAGGFLTVESEPGQGATFRIHLPQADATELEPLDVRAAPQQTGVVPPICSVLLVQQRSPERQASVEWLAAAGYRVLTATDTASAAEVLSELRTDVLIADATLRDGLGAVLLRSARSVHAGLRTLLIDGAERNFEGIDGVLVRPFGSEELVAAVERLKTTSAASSA